MGGTGSMKRDKARLSETTEIGPSYAKSVICISYASLYVSLTDIRQNSKKIAWLDFYYTSDVFVKLTSS